ncbi:hypothetical protein FC19_GL001120 [Liquorilactobacillus aquaticus DSM 21051]|uniref:HTH tetR-type domain-containing protein n=1 Tax=Liquorilactobacillus aquaticus DSM 21051 TaxID=1423725 RepID=A0A0R2CX79_9LACO|nr:TetR family transcriptional regulator [Liquorilactobacillus aquaticus]KRM96053.1 hypothetical protein FC19_GL001120 [Liquorilactobacillus aquaticus DSM 21051]
MSDLRKTRTKRDIFISFEELLEEQPFEEITVKQLVESAMIHRNTFYLHYPDKYHLLESWLYEKLKSSNISINLFLKRPFDYISQIYREQFFKVFRKQREDNSFTNIITKVFINMLLSQNKDVQNFFIIGKIAAIIHWIQYTNQPLNIFEDGPILDQIFQSEKFPED